MVFSLRVEYASRLATLTLSGSIILCLVQVIGGLRVSAEMAMERISGGERLYLATSPMVSLPLLKSDTIT